MKRTVLVLFYSLISAFCLSSITYAQEIRYAITKQIDANGIEHKMDAVRYLTLTNNIITCNNPASEYQYSHNENGNYIYYKLVTGINVDLYGGVSNSKSIYRYSFLIASPDFSVINLCDMNPSSEKITNILVLERQEAPSMGTLYR